MREEIEIVMPETLREWKIAKYAAYILACSFGSDRLAKQLAEATYPDDKAPSR